MAPNNNTFRIGELSKQWVAYIIKGGIKKTEFSEIEHGLMRAENRLRNY